MEFTLPLEEAMEIDNEYFYWLYFLVCNNEYCDKKSFIKLFKHLNAIDYRYCMTMDENRGKDGLGLRSRFRYEHGFDRDEIAAYMDMRPCSVLEFLIGMALRLEEDYMHDANIGDRTGLWFWTMLKSIGIASMSDDSFYEKFVDEDIDILLDRQFSPDGRGGLFTIEHCNKDLRTVEFWSSGILYLHKYIQEN